ncbi:ABC transporter substrate-binding protein [Haloarcula nitratireducens]|uniref:Extracellular solute-binding protein n=1 Tax=Haloarcula nitratireducens TaxID=2487749 RepID=A0AAW4PH23_9EURY|nr:extracellular solute-binding protein [Halomicroarcula nitratireducens]MBX0297218.1 extracellular solute-binding protein [Halomicroarcula nitratireducens]
MRNSSTVSESKRTDGSSDRVNRRKVLAATAGLSATALAGCVGGGPSQGGEEGNATDETTEGSQGSGDATTTSGEYPDYSGNTLTVATWAGIYAEAFEKSVARMFEERTGANVEVAPAGGSILTEIQSAPEDNPPYDIAAAEGFFYWQGRNENLFQEIDTSKISNLDNVYSYLKDLRGTKYGVPTDGSLEGIVYNTNVGWEPTTWTDLLSDKQGTDRIGFEGAWYIYPMEVAAVSLDNKTGIQELYDEQSHQAVLDRLREFGQNVELWTGSFAEIETSLKQGIINFSMWYSGMGNAAASQQEQLGFVTPDKTAGYLDHYCPVRGSEKTQMAHDFLNHMIDPAVQSEWAKTGYVFTTNKEATYPEQTKSQYPSSNSEWKQVSIADFTKLSEYSSMFSSKFQEIKG